MKHCHFSHFLYRAFHSPGFRLSTGLGFIVAVCQIVQMFSPVDTGFSYPSSLYEMWLGGRMGVLCECSGVSAASSFRNAPLFVQSGRGQKVRLSDSAADSRKASFRLFSICCQHLFIRLCCCGAPLFGKSFSECSHLSRTHAAAFHLYLFTIAARV